MVVSIIFPLTSFERLLEKLYRWQWNINFTKWLQLLLQGRCVVLTRIYQHNSWLWYGSVDLANRYFSILSIKIIISSSCLYARRATVRFYNHGPKPCSIVCCLYHKRVHRILGLLCMWQKVTDFIERDYNFMEIGTGV